MSSLGDGAGSNHCGQVTDRFVIRPDREGFSVVDIWTGEAAVIAMTPQTGMPEVDAQHLAELLNRRSESGERSVPT